MERLLRYFLGLISISVLSMFSLAQAQEITIDMTKGSVKIIDAETIRINGISVKQGAKDLGTFSDVIFKFDPKTVALNPISGKLGRWLSGDTIPGFLLSGPSGSRADLRTVGTYDTAKKEWTVMFTRSLITPFPDDDRQFDFTKAENVYSIGVAVLDNAMGNNETMVPQDSGPYTLGNEASTATLKAKKETPKNAAGFTGSSITTKGGAKVPPVVLKAAYDDKNIYLLATWKDETMDVSKERWEFDGTKWIRSAASTKLGGEPGKFDEDRIAIWFDINAQDFKTEGCLALCHSDRMRSRNADGKADLWHWKAARTNPLGYADDQRLAPGKWVTPGRSDDTGTGLESANKSADGTLPAHQAANDPGTRANFLIKLPEESQYAVPFVP